MKKKNIILIATALFIGSGLLFAFTTGNKTSSTCTESTEKSCEKKKGEAPGGMLWESLSSQFFTSSGS